MICSKCGCDQGTPAQFCRQCGSPLMTGVPLMAPAPFPQGSFYRQEMRVRQNVQILGIMWCIYGAFRILTVLFALGLFHALGNTGVFAGMPDGVAHVLHALAPVFGLVVVLLGSADILTGYGLLTAKPWARILAMIVGILALLKLPFGTALGIYTLWVLAPQASAAEWEAATVA